MKNCTSGKWFLLLGGFCLLWSAGAGELRAGQNFPTHVSVFGKSSPKSVARPQKVSSAKEADLRQLMKELHSKEDVADAIRDTDAVFRPLLLQALPAGPYRRRFVEILFEKMHATATPEALLNSQIPVYVQYLSDAEIKGLIKFYKTPVGQNWIRVRPKLNAALQARMNAAARRMWLEIIRETLKEHPEFAGECKFALKCVRTLER